MHLRWDPKKWAIDRYVPGSQAPGGQGFLPTLHNSAALWHMSGALWISVEWAYKSDRGIPREDLPIALLASLFVYLCLHWGFPYGSVGKEFICNGGDLGLIPGLGRFPRRRAWQPTPVFLPGEFPWTEEPGGLQSMGSQRVRRD